MSASTSRSTTAKPQDSKDSWRYVIVLSKFTIMFLDAGLAKSLGVLLPVMITRYNTDYKTMGMICSMPATLAYFAGGYIIVALNGLLFYNGMTRTFAVSHAFTKPPIVV